MPATLARPTPRRMIRPSDHRAQGLIGCWTFREGAGTSIGDVSRNIHLGAASMTGTNWSWGDGPWNAGAPGAGGALVLGGTDSYATVPIAGSALLTPQSFTIEAWVKVASVAASSFGTLLSRFSSDYRILAGATSGHWQVDVSGRLSSGAKDTGLAWTANAWQHVVLRSVPGETAFFANGVKAIFDTGTGAVTYTTNGTLQFGARTGGLFLNGSIALVRMWERPLDDIDVEDLYADPWAMWARRSSIIDYAALAGPPATKAVTGQGVGPWTPGQGKLAAKASVAGKAAGLWTPGQGTLAGKASVAGHGAGPALPGQGQAKASASLRGLASPAWTPGAGQVTSTAPGARSVIGQGVGPATPGLGAIAAAAAILGDGAAGSAAGAGSLAAAAAILGSTTPAWTPGAGTITGGISPLPRNLRRAIVAAFEAAGLADVAGPMSLAEGGQSSGSRYATYKVMKGSLIRSSTSSKIRDHTLRVRCHDVTADAADQAAEAVAEALEGTTLIHQLGFAGPLYETGRRVDRDARGQGGPPQRGQAGSPAWFAEVEFSAREVRATP